VKNRRKSLSNSLSVIDELKLIAVFYSERQCDYLTQNSSSCSTYHRSPGHQTMARPATPNTMHHNHGTLTTALAALDPEISSSTSNIHQEIYFNTRT